MCVNSWEWSGDHLRQSMSGDQISSPKATNVTAAVEFKLKNASLYIYYRSRLPEVFCKEVVFKNFPKFTR